MVNKVNEIDDLFGFADICEADNYLIYGTSCCGSYTPKPGCGDKVAGNECYDGGTQKGVSMGSTGSK